MRKGTLTDAQTLGMYEDGVSVIALCVHESMSPYGIYGRIGRERKRRRSRGRRIVLVRKAPQPTYDSFDALREAVERLEKMLA